MACGLLSVVGNEDLWWYLASGDEILRRHAIPSSDPFLFTSAARDTWVTTSREQATWVTHSWLWQVLVAGLHRAFGIEGLAVFAALAAGLLTTLLFRQGRCDRFGLVNTLVAMGVLFACIDRLALRAELAGWLLFAVYAVLLERGRRFDLRRVALFAALQWLWANLHGSYVLGLGLVFSYSVGDFVQSRTGSGREASPRWTAAPLWLAPALCLVSLAMPRLGRERVLDAVALVKQLVASTAGRYATPVEEWQSPYAPGLADLAATHLVTVAVGLLGFAATRRPRRLARALVFVGMGLLAVAAGRFVGGFALAAGLVTLWNLSELRPGLAQRLHRLSSRTLALQAAAACLLGALLVATGLARFVTRDELEVGQSRGSWVTLHPQFTSPGAAAYVREAGLSGRVFNDVTLGGYLDHTLYPEHQLYIDTRNLSASVTQDYRRAMRNPAYWRALDRRYGFALVVLGNVRVPSLPLRRALATDPNWKLVYFDPQAAVFARANGTLPPPRFAPHGGARGVPYLGGAREGWRAWLPARGEGLLECYLDALLELGRPADAAALADEALALEPDQIFWLQARALSRLRAGQARLAAEDYAQVTQRMPRNADAQFRYALALHQAGDDAGALAMLDRLAALQPDHGEAKTLRRRIEAGARVDGPRRGPGGGGGAGPGDPARP